MIIQNSAVNIMFPWCENIKKKYILNEKILNKDFNEASILPIPDDAPTEIPRIIIKTKGEHSQLSIAPEAVNFQTVYTDSFIKDWKSCEAYIKARIEAVYRLTDIFTSKKYNYTGIVTNLIWDDISENGNKILYENLLKNIPADNLDDLLVKYTYVEDNRYYVNITLQSVKIYDDSADNKAGNFADDKCKAHTIGITLDINDRYMFNKYKEYCSTKKDFDSLLELTSKLIDSKLKALVETGVY